MGPKKRAKASAGSKKRTRFFSSNDSNIDGTGNKNLSSKSYYLFKSEPSEFSLSDLKECGEKGDHWTGVRNFEARNIMREMKVGDEAFFYHSCSKPPGIVGLCKIIEESTTDKTCFDEKSKYFDAKSTTENPRWDCVTVGFLKEFDQMLTLQEIKDVFDAAEEGSPMKELALLRRNRLSVTRVTGEQWKIIHNLIDDKIKHNKL